MGCQSELIQLHFYAMKICSRDQSTTKNAIHMQDENIYPRQSIYKEPKCSV